MTDKKYTDEEIVKALECCTNGSEFCGDCPFSKNGECKQASLLILARSLINRQKAEIERLTHKCDDCAGCTQWNCDCSLIRAEAIEEFAERLRASCDAPHWCVWLSEIDQIKKELTEGRQ